MKKIFLFIILVSALAACKKGETFREPTFPGFSGSGEFATWIVYAYNLNDTNYLKTVLPPAIPSTQTINNFFTTLSNLAGKEVSAYSIRLYKTGEVGLIEKNAQNQNVWVKQSTLKWQSASPYINILRNVNGSWVKVMEGIINVDKLLLKYYRSYWGDTSADKEKTAMEITYFIQI
jgi:hypothetical protein